jgi:ankyrin repeat protein
VFDLLLSKGADVNLRVEEGLTPAMVAVGVKGAGAQAKGALAKAQWLLGECCSSCTCGHAPSRHGPCGHAKSHAQHAGVNLGDSMVYSLCTVLPHDAHLCAGSTAHDRCGANLAVCVQTYWLDSNSLGKIRVPAVAPRHPPADAGADACAVDAEGRDMLQHACLAGRGDCVALALKAGCPLPATGVRRQ